MENLFAVAAPGLAPFTAVELCRLGLVDPAQETKITADDEGGGISFVGDLQAIYRANLHLRTASRVLVRLGEFYAAAFSELRKKASRLEWERYLQPGQAVDVRATCHKSRLYHSGGVAERVAGAIGDCLGKQPVLFRGKTEDGESLAQLIVVRLVHDRCTISIDSSGDLLHRRGYRLATAKAPLRETLAAGMLLASGWHPGAPLIDPFCGSGTIPIEAALMAKGIAPGKARRFAFMAWPGYHSDGWETALAAAQAAETHGELSIFASDRDAGAIEMARANAERAGVVECIEFVCQAVSAIAPAGVGWMVTNPPYGLRVRSSHDLRNLYAQLGKVLRAKCPGWQVAILCSDLQLLYQTRLKLDASLSMVNGGVAVRLARGSVGNG